MLVVEWFKIPWRLLTLLQGKAKVAFNLKHYPATFLAMEELTDLQKVVTLSALTDETSVAGE